MLTITGLHHVTAISGLPQQNIDFYTGPLRQKLVKQTVNFDAPDTYHLYYGDPRGSPGTIVSFFPFVDAAPGHAGPGMASAIAYAVPNGGLETWMLRLAEQGVGFEAPAIRFGEKLIVLHDPDGLQIELIEADYLKQNGSSDDAGGNDDGLHSVTLWVDEHTRTARVLTELFGYQEWGRESLDGAQRIRYRSSEGQRASLVDLIYSDDRSLGRQGTGTIHHVAFRTETVEVLSEWRKQVEGFGLIPTAVIDRQYFESVYFREPGGLLFEIATDDPGFSVDEAPDSLGAQLMLPPQYERRRADIERVLPPIKAPR